MASEKGSAEGALQRHRIFSLDCSSVPSAEAASPLFRADVASERIRVTDVRWTPSAATAFAEITS